MTYRRIALLAALTVAASCSDDPSAPVATSGSFSFAFGGTQISGTYSATGTIPVSAADETTREWAAGFREDAEQAIGAVALVPRANARYDYAFVVVAGTTTGTYTIDTDACSGTTSFCSGMILWYNLSDAQNATGEVFCGLDAGTVTVTEATSSRLRGTFSGTGSCVSDASSGTFTVTNGAFDVPVATDAPIASIRTGAEWAR